MAWDASVETLLQKYCDEAQVREGLHRRSYYKYKRLTTCFSLPVICLSALSGSFQFLSKGYPEIEQYIVTGTASISIFTSIISAVAAYLKQGPSLPKFPPAGSFPPNGRATPDVSALGEGYQVYVSGKVQSVGGTSASSPAFAGYVSLLNEARFKAG